MQRNPDEGRNTKDEVTMIVGMKESKNVKNKITTGEINYNNKRSC